MGWFRFLNVFQQQLKCDWGEKQSPKCPHLPKLWAIRKQNKRSLMCVRHFFKICKVYVFLNFDSFFKFNLMTLGSFRVCLAKLAFAKKMLLYVRKYNYDAGMTWWWGTPKNSLEKINMKRFQPNGKNLGNPDSHFVKALLTDVPRFEAFIHLRFIARIFPPWDISGKLVLKRKRKKICPKETFKIEI